MASSPRRAGTRRTMETAGARPGTGFFTSRLGRPRRQTSALPCPAARRTVPVAARCSSTTSCTALIMRQMSTRTGCGRWALPPPPPPSPRCGPCCPGSPPPPPPCSARTRGRLCFKAVPSCGPQTPPTPRSRTWWGTRSLRGSGRAPRSCCLRRAPPFTASLGGQRRPRTRSGTTRTCCTQRPPPSCTRMTPRRRRLRCWRVPLRAQTGGGWSPRPRPRVTCRRPAHPPRPRCPPSRQPPPRPLPPPPRCSLRRGPRLCH